MTVPIKINEDNKLQESIYMNCHFNNYHISNNHPNDANSLKNQEFIYMSTMKIYCGIIKIDFTKGLIYFVSWCVNIRSKLQSFLVFCKIFSMFRQQFYIKSLKCKNSVKFIK